MMAKGAIAAAVLLLLTACAESLRPETNRPYISAPPQGTPARGLPAQDLPPGNCGVFLFTRDPTPRFVLFDHLDAGLVRIWLDGAMHHVTVEPRRDPPGEGRTYRRLLTVEGQTLLFTGEADPPVAGEAAIPRAVMRRTLPDGSQASVALSGVFLCRAP